MNKVIDIFTNEVFYSKENNSPFPFSPVRHEDGEVYWQRWDWQTDTITTYTLQEAFEKLQGMYVALLNNHKAIK